MEKMGAQGPSGDDTVSVTIHDDDVINMSEKSAKQESLTNNSFSSVKMSVAATSLHTSPSLCFCFSQES